MNPRRIRAPVMASKHFIRVGCAMALFIVDSGSRAQLPLLILIIVGIDEKGYMIPRNVAADNLKRTFPLSQQAQSHDIIT